jgi:pimeloyl-ACP methyl ester carboxylesterase
MPDPVALPVPRDAVVLAAERSGRGDGAPVVLLHAGVADRRGWRGVAARLAGAGHAVVAYDRRGFGDTPPGTAPFRHLDDLLAVLDAAGPGAGPAWLVGNSMGGALALDAALEASGRVAGLVLIAPAVSGAPEPGDDELDPATAAVAAELEAAEAAGDAEALNRVEVRLWLDGPSAPEGRVGGEARALALAMNAAALAHGLPEGAGESGADAWGRLEELRLPVTVAWGDLDVPVVVERSRAIAARVPGARAVALRGRAHLPALEDPAEVAGVVLDAIAAAGRHGD